MNYCSWATGNTVANCVPQNCSPVSQSGMYTPQYFPTQGSTVNPVNAHYIRVNNAVTIYLTFLATINATVPNPPAINFSLPIPPINPFSNYVSVIGVGNLYNGDLQTDNANTTVSARIYSIPGTSLGNVTATNNYTYTVGKSYLLSVVANYFIQ